jgi:predicted N-formylglutamate amidohydrolase
VTWLIVSSGIGSLFLVTTENHRELLGPGDPAPVGLVNSAGRSPFLLIGDHAGIAIPRALGTLGLRAEDLGRHIACDIGVLGLGERLAGRLDAAFIHQLYSRLVVDCNRDPNSAEAMPACSDGTEITGNRHLTAKEREERVRAIHAPYQKAIAEHIAQRAGMRTILVSLHSFTPAMGGQGRPWSIGVLYDGGDTSFARTLLGVLREHDDSVIGDNQPYVMDATDHSVPRHAYGARLPYAELEIRQDLIDSPEGGEDMSARIAGVLLEAGDRLAEY